MNFRGGSTTDRGVLASQTLGAPVTYVMTIRPVTEGASAFGYLFAHGGAPSQRALLRWNQSAGQRRLRFVANWSSVGTWEMAAGFAAFPRLLGVAVTYDGSAAGNDPILYTLVDNVFSVLTVAGGGLTRTATPSGTLAADGGTLYLGNSGTGNQAFDGTIDEFAALRRVLTADEVRSAVYRGVLSQLRLLHGYWPLARIQGSLTNDYSGNGRHFTLEGAPTAGYNAVPHYPVGVGAA